MTLCQSLTSDFESEMKRTRPLLERVPMSDFKPHEKSMALNYLATHVAELPSWFQFTLESESFHLPDGFKMDIATTTDDLLARFDKSVAIGREWIGKVSRLAAPIITSSRRFEGKKYALVFAWWTFLQILFWIGVSPFVLGKMYLHVRSSILVS